MAGADIDWGEYGRIDPGEMTVGLSLRRVGGRIVATVRFENRSGRVLHPFVFNLASRLTVTLDGREVPYPGPMIKVALSADLYATLAPSAAVEVPMDLVASHALSPTAAGSLAVHFEGVGLPTGEGEAEARLTLG